MVTPVSCNKPNHTEAQCWKKLKCPYCHETGHNPQRCVHIPDNNNNNTEHISSKNDSKKVAFKSVFNNAVNKFNKSDEYLCDKSQFDLISNSIAHLKYDSSLTDVSEDNGMLVDVDESNHKSTNESVVEEYNSNSHTVN